MKTVLGSIHNCFQKDRPMSSDTPFKFDPKWRPNTFLLFALLDKALHDREHPDLKEYSESLKQESLSILTGIGALNLDGSIRYDAIQFGTAWDGNDLDWFHSKFLKVPTYQETIQAIKQKDIDTLHGKCGYLNLARKLGQVARLDPAIFITVGDRAFNEDVLHTLLCGILKNEGDKITIYDLCMNMASVGVTPYRLERMFRKAMKTYSYGFPFQAKAIGIRQPGYEETVVHLKSDGFDFASISSGSFKLGSVLNHSELVRIT